jgi:hypothetical protein
MPFNVGEHLFFAEHTPHSKWTSPGLVDTGYAAFLSDRISYSAGDRYPIEE